MSETFKLASKSRIYSLTVTADPIKLCTKNPTRLMIAVQVTSGTAYITSGQNKPYTEGIQVTSSLPYSNDTTDAELWILTSTSTAAVIVQEDTD